MFMLLGDGITRLHTQLTLRYGKIPEPLTILRLLEQLLTSSIEEGDGTSSLLNHSLYLLGFNYYGSTLVGNGITTFGRGTLWHNHERGWLGGQRLLTGSTHTNNLVVHYFKVHYLGLTTIRHNSHIVSVGLHHCCHHG